MTHIDSDGLIQELKTLSNLDLWAISNAQFTIFSYMISARSQRRIWTTLCQQIRTGSVFLGMGETLAQINSSTSLELTSWPLPGHIQGVETFHYSQQFILGTGVEQLYTYKHTPVTWRKNSSTDDNHQAITKTAMNRASKWERLGNRKKATQCTLKGYNI